MPLQLAFGLEAQRAELLDARLDVRGIGGLGWEDVDFFRCELYNYEYIYIYIEYRIKDVSIIFYVTYIT